MSNTLARLAAGFGALVTAPLKPARRAATRAIAADRLIERVSVSTKYGPIVFFTDSARAAAYPRDFHTDEPDMLSWIDAMPDGAVFWDIGANIGMFALYAAKRGVSVLAFEPGSGSYLTLHRNIELNGLAERISAYCLAFSDSNGLGTLNMTSNDSGSSEHAVGVDINAQENPIDVAYRHAALVMSMDAFAGTFDPPHPTHIKIDVDSIEDKIIAGAANLLRGGPVASVMVEVMGDPGTPRNRRIFALMGEMGYAPKPRPAGARNVEFLRTGDDG